jgi:hypothetical protein
MPLPQGLITGKTARLPTDWKAQPKAHGRPQHEPGKMNKREARYASDLEIQRKSGDIAWWAFEPIKLRLADRTFYTPDFVVMLNDGSIEFHEVKGHFEDDAAVKHKVAIETYWMFEFKIIR